MNPDYKGISIGTGIMGRLVSIANNPYYQLWMESHLLCTLNPKAQFICKIGRYSYWALDHAGEKKVIIEFAPGSFCWALNNYGWWVYRVNGNTWANECGL